PLPRGVRTRARAARAPRLAGGSRPLRSRRRDADGGGAGGGQRSALRTHRDLPRLVGRLPLAEASLPAGRGDLRPDGGDGLGAGAKTEAKAVALGRRARGASARGRG